MKTWFTQASARRAGLFLSVMTCAIVFYAHSKNLLTCSDPPLGSELSVECGAESAWPHLREDLAG